MPWLLDAVSLDEQLERRLVATGVLELVDAALADREHPRAKVQVLVDLRLRRKRLEIALYKLIAGRVTPGVGTLPPRVVEQLLGCRIEVELPWGEHANMAPLPHARADVRARLEDQRLKAAVEEAPPAANPTGPAPITAMG